MKRVHPNLSGIIICAWIALLLSVGGCKSSSSGIAGNPFLSPDRVPPPSTRALLPGQAQPYYPGDPLPAMQTATTSPSNAVAANPTTADTRSSTGRTLAWNAPGTASPSPSPVPPIAAPSALPSSAIASENEGAVAVPVDADPLRFALPPPREPENAAPIAAAAPAPKPQPIQPASAQPPQGVLLASYNAPIANNPLPAVSSLTMPAPQQISSPWRSPQIVQPATRPTYAAQPAIVQPPTVSPLKLPAPPITPAVQPQVAIPNNTMGVSLRPVPSPTPRVRIPGYVESPASVVDGFRPRTNMQ